MAETSADRSSHTDPERADAPADRWVTLTEAAQITGIDRDALYRHLVARKHGTVRRTEVPGGRWRWEVRTTDLASVKFPGQGHGRQWSGPVTEETLDRLMKALEPQDFSLDIVLTRG